MVVLGGFPNIMHKLSEEGEKVEVAPKGVSAPESLTYSQYVIQKGKIITLIERIESGKFIKRRVCSFDGKKWSD